MVGLKHTPVQKADAITVAKRLLKEFLPQFGIPIYLGSDKVLILRIR